jgi:FAD:protein FMN transferase
MIASPSSTRSSFPAFPGMGSPCEIAVLGGDPDRLFSLAQNRVEDLEQKWSRFRSDSELSALNTCSVTSRASLDEKVSVKVSADTLLLFDRSLYAWRTTKGRFDPTVLGSVVAAGYDRSFEKLGSSFRTSQPTTAAPGCENITIDTAQQRVSIPAGVGFDAGGIGKGLAADLVVEALLEAGALGVCASIGGDVRVSGEVPDAGWRVGIANPFNDADLISVLALADHGVATSSRLMRRWNVDGEDRNHLIDPATGKSANGYVSATIVTGEAWWSEALAKVAMLDGKPTLRSLPFFGGAGLFVDADRSVFTCGRYEKFEAARERVLR